MARFRREQFGFLTPDAAPDDLLCRSFSIPNDSRWLGNFMGALLDLCEPQNWRAYGALTPDEAAAAYQQIFDAGYLNETTCTAETVPVPYWEADNIDAASDTAPADDQPWYGRWDGETWTDAAAEWVLSGVALYADPSGSALQFVSEIRAFRLWFRATPFGAKVAVYMDSNLFQLIDLYASGNQPVFIDIVSPGSTLMIVNTGTANPLASRNTNGNYDMWIMRGQLYDVLPQNIRYNPDCDCVQRTYDGGVTWQYSPQDDPRTSPAAAQPPVLTDNTRCDAAASIVANFEDGLNGVIGQIQAGTTALGLASWILTFLDFLDGLGALIQLLIDFATTVIDVGVTALAAAFTDDVYTTLKCIIYCDISVGTITQAQFDKIGQDVASAFGELSTVNIVFGGWLNQLGASQLQTIAAVKHIPGDCSTCGDCPYDVNISGIDLQSQFLSANAGGAPCYQAGFWDETIPGWQAGIGTCGRSAYWIYAIFTVPEGSTFTGWTMYYNPSSVNTDSVIKGMGGVVNGVTVVNFSGTTSVPSPLHVDLPTPAVAGDTVEIICSINASAYRTDLPMYRVDIQGTGIPALTGISF